MFPHDYGFESLPLKFGLHDHEEGVVKVVFDTNKVKESLDQHETTTDDNVKRAIQFLGSSQPVQVIVHFRGEETIDIGYQVLQRFLDHIGPNGSSRDPVQNGQELVCLISPNA